MAEIVNLRRARKAKARAEKDRQAAENRVLHGMSKSEREQRAADGEAARKRLDGHLRRPKDDGTT